MLTLGQCLTSKFISQENDKVIIIDQDGTSDLECCMYGKCHCSNLSLALEHIQGNTEIRIQSDISLHNAVVFGNVTNVKITGNSNPTVRCDHQGGLVGKNINYIVIQGITWDGCNGINMLNFTDVHVVKCNFLNFINFALTLHGLGSVHVNGNAFSHNDGCVDALAPSVTILGSKFYGDSGNGALVIDTKTAFYNTKSKVIMTVTIENCEFRKILDNCVYCLGSVGLLPNVSIVSTNFTDNENTAVNVEYCNITLNNVTFYNNVNVNSGYINDGGAIRVYNGTVNMTGNVLFHHNRAGNNGGAIYLNHSGLYASQGSYLFHNNTADNGGAIYVGEGAKMFALHSETSLEFLDNHAEYNGGAVYVDLYYMKDATVSHQLSGYYNNLLTSAKCTCDFSNTANIDNCAYISENTPSPIVNFTATSTCTVLPYYKHSFVNVNVTDITDEYLIFWSHDLHLAITIECFSDTVGPSNVSFNCDHCNNTSPLTCTTDIETDSETGVCTVIGNNTILECLNFNMITCEILHLNGAVSNIYVIVQRFGHNCDDIAHAYFYGLCCPICLPNPTVPDCWQQNFLPGYWYDNGYRRYVTVCPIGHCDQHFRIGNVVYSPFATFPDRNLQCNKHWTGLACGECNYSAGYAIKYDTTECIPVDECLTMSVTYSLLILFGVSFFYWIAIISFIFVLLHFKFDITAGYAYGLLFYYSVLEQLVNDVTIRVARNLESINGYYIYDAYGLNDFHSDYEFMRLKILPLLSSIGNLKPPFTGSINLCLGNAKMIDHLMLGYIHPLIVTFLVGIIFILARNFVLAARTIGRFVNSKSICILLLLSYSSITYTSLQLLKPLPVFNSYGSLSTMQVYWSPNVQYFSGRHLGYGIIAMLCELIIGIGLPLVLIFQRYLIRYCNINFTSLNLITDQLKGCYKEEYRWFAAYYLICRHVLYGVLNLVDYSSGFWANYVILDTPFPKFTIMITICILILVLHLWAQPYKKKGLNIFDSCVLLILVGLLINSVELYRDRMIGVVFWFLPLMIFINYLAYFTKLKYLIILCSCAAVFSTTFHFGTYVNVFVILLLTSSFIIFIVYVVYALKCLYTRCHNTRPRYVAINEQNDDIDENNDNDVTEVSMVMC